MGWSRPDLQLHPIGDAAYSRGRARFRLVELRAPSILRSLADRVNSGESFASLADELGCDPGYVGVVLNRSGLLTPKPPEAPAKTARQKARERMHQRSSS